MKEIVNLDYVKAWFTSYLGQTAIHGSNCGNEPAHNAYSQNATEFGIINTNKTIGIGNNGLPLEKKAFIEYFLYSRKPVGNRLNESGFWGVGGSKIFPIRFGVPDYVVTNISGKYYKYNYNWKGFDKYGDFTGASAVNSLEELSVDSEEITHTEFRKLSFADKFENEPTFFFNIRKYSDENDINFSAGSIINNLNNTFHATRNNIKYFVYHKDKYFRGRQGYFPTTRNGEVIREIEDLECIGKNVEIQGGFFDVYHYKYEYTENNVAAALLIKEKTSDYKDVFEGSGKPSSVYNHFFNTERIHLLSVSKGADMMKDVRYNYSNCVFLQVGGTFKYSTIKSATIDSKLDEESTKIHKDYIDNNISKQHGGNKGEDSKVLECYTALMESSVHSGNLLSSIKLFTDDSLSQSEILNELNHLNFKPIKSREHDWAIKNNNDEWILNLEFMNDSADWDHIDKLNFTLDEDGIPYQVLIVDSYSKNKEKIASFKTALMNKNVVHLKKVWVITLSDFMKFNHKNMNQKGLIFEK